jgi:hypothetical protein
LLPQKEPHLCCQLATQNCTRVYQGVSIDTKATSA